MVYGSFARIRCIFSAVATAVFLMVWRNFGSSFEVKNFMGFPIQVMVQRDLFANKLVALMERRQQANQDLYDIYFLLKNNWDINHEIIQQRTGSVLKEYLNTCLNHIRSLTQRHILAGLGDLLSPEKKDWVKSNLINELLFKLEQRRDLL